MGATDLRARILCEATHLFAEHGYAATSVREVVEASGCTKPALYYYFRNKEALFLEAIRTETQALTAIIERQLSIDADARARLSEGMRMFLDHARSNAMGMRLLFRAELQPDNGQPAFDFVTIRASHMALIRGMLERGVRDHQIRADIDLGDATMAVIGMVDRWFQEWLRGAPLPDDLAERVLKIFFEGVAVRPHPEG